MHLTADIAKRSSQFVRHIFAAEWSSGTKCDCDVRYTTSVFKERILFLNLLQKKYVERVRGQIKLFQKPTGINVYTLAKVE